MKVLLRNTLCIAIVSLLLLHTNYLAFYYALYTININQLSENYCEKKKPCCVAKCFLSNKMGEANSNSHKGEVIEIKIKLSEFRITDPAISSHQKDLIQQYFYPYNFYKLDYIVEIDHPPQS